MRKDRVVDYSIGCILLFLLATFLFRILTCFLSMGRSIAMITTTVNVMKVIPTMDPTLMALGRESSVDHPTKLC